jgi:flagellar hook-length control protein FliK
MTATHVGALAASTIAAKTATATSAPEAPGAAPFHQRLQDARGQGGASAPAHAAPDGKPQRGPDPGRDRGGDPSPRAPDSRTSSPASARLEKPANAAATSPGPSADATAPAAAVAVPAPAPEAVADIAAAEPVAGKDGGEHEEAATALVEAMLALLGPAPARPGAGAVDPGVAAAAAQLAAARAGLAAPGKPGAGAAPAIDPAVLAATAAAPAAELPKLDPGAVRDTAKADAMPGVAPAITHAAALPAPTTAPVPVAPAHAFAQELGQQLAWFVGHDVKQARIRLHPEELGSLDLKISVQHNRVDVVFQAQHPGAVTAVQQGLPQLDQMLAQHGLSLGHADVGRHDRGDQPGQGGQGEEISGIDEVAGPAHVTPLTQLGLVDAFA